MASSQDVGDVILWAFTLILFPMFWVVASSGLNAFSGLVPKGDFYRYEKKVHSKKENRRQYPIKVSLWVWGIGWIITGICILIPTFYVYDIAGGFSTGNPVIPNNIVLLTSSIFLAWLSIAWAPSYFKSCNSCNNILWMNVAGMVVALIVLILYLSSTSSGWAFFLIEPIVWNFLVAVKIYLESPCAGYPVTGPGYGHCE